MEKEFDKEWMLSTIKDIRARLDVALVDENCDDLHELSALRDQYEHAMQRSIGDIDLILEDLETPEAA